MDKGSGRVSDLRYLQLLARQYPNTRAASSEIINLQAILNLPKGTEHFMSDLHGEYEAFLHILNSASGAVREKCDILFENTMTREERARLATLIYYPEEKLREIHETVGDIGEWYKLTLHRLIEICPASSPPNTPGPRCARRFPEILNISSTSCSTSTDMTATRSNITRISLPPLSM